MQICFFSGIYLFTIQYNTRTCGALSLCGPTTVEFYKNGEAIRTFSRNLATDNKSDMDMVSATILSEGSSGDEFYLKLIKTVGHGVTHLHFCGWLTN